MNPPSTPLVAVAWLRTLPGLLAGVATTRPTDTATWSATGFVTVSAVGSAGNRDVPALRLPIVRLDSWGVSPGSSRPPRNLALGNLELIRGAIDSAPAATVQPGTGYAPAIVQHAWVESAEPQEIPDPDTSYAHFILDIGLAWVRAE